MISYEHFTVLLENQVRDIISYIFFGGLTTVVNYLIYLPVYNMLGLSAALSNAIAWVVAVAFAYVTNKLFVFDKETEERIYFEVN